MCLVIEELPVDFSDTLHPFEVKLSPELQIVIQNRPSSANKIICFIKISIITIKKSFKNL